MPFIEVIVIVLFSLFFLLGGFLISSAKANMGYTWLGVFFLVLGLNFLDGLLLINGFYLENPQVAFWEDPLVLTYGPLIWLYSRFYTGKTTFRLSKEGLHFIPFVLSEILLVYQHFNVSESDKLELIRQIHQLEMGADQWVVIFPLFIVVFIYIYFARLNLIHFRLETRDYYATIDSEWYMSVMDFVLLIFFLSFLSSIVQLTGIPQYYYWSLLILNMLITVIMYLILFKALKEPVLTQPRQASGITKLSDLEIDWIEQEVKKQMETEKIYRQADLTLDKLSKRINKSSRDISWVINQRMAKNFYDLVNDYRIEEAKLLMQHPKDAKQTILEILYEVGYNSKSSFNTQFRLRTGVTPSEFKKLGS